MGAPLHPWATSQFTVYSQILWQIQRSREHCCDIKLDFRSDGSIEIRISSPTMFHKAIWRSNHFMALNTVEIQNDQSVLTDLICHLVQTEPKREHHRINPAKSI
jgi:hypothetical protein